FRVGLQDPYALVAARQRLGVKAPALERGPHVVAKNLEARGFERIRREPPGATDAQRLPEKSGNRDGSRTERLSSASPHRRERIAHLSRERPQESPHSCRHERRSPKLLHARKHAANPPSRPDSAVSERRQRPLPNRSAHGLSQNVQKRPELRTLSTQLLRR